MPQQANNPTRKVTLTSATPTPSVAGKVTTFILQMLTGTATAGDLIEDIGLNEEDALFGADSDIATAIREFRKNNKVSQINAVPLTDNVGGAEATSDLVFAGTATANGTIDIFIGNTERVYNVPVIIGDTATLLGDKLDALILADTKSLVTSSNTTGTVTLTAKHKGTTGNNIGIIVEGSVAGSTVTLNAMSGGATDPVVSAVPALLTKQTDIITHSEYDYSLFATLLDDRFNSENVALDGRVFISVNDSKANLKALIGAENSQSLVIHGDSIESLATKKASAVFGMPYQKLSQLQSIRTLRLEPTFEVITNFVTTRAPLDQFSSVALSSLPLFNTPIGLPVIPTNQGFSKDEVKELRTAQITLFGNNVANNQLITDAVFTTYQTDVTGNADVTFKYLNYVDTETACREYLLKALAIDYAQSRLTLGTVQGNKRDTTTTAKVRKQWKIYYADLASDDYALLQGGVIEETGENISAIVNRNTDISLDGAKGQVTITSILPIMVQLREFLAPIQIVFDVNKF